MKDLKSLVKKYWFPSIFGFVLSGVTHVRHMLLDAFNVNHLLHHLEVFVLYNGVYHRVTQHTGNQVGKHLYVIASRTIAACSGSIYIVTFLPLILQGEFG